MSTPKLHGCTHHCSTGSHLECIIVSNRAKHQECPILRFFSYWRCRTDFLSGAGKHERTAKCMGIQERVKAQLMEADSVQSASSLAVDSDSDNEDGSVGTSGAAAHTSTLSLFGRAFKVSRHERHMHLSHFLRSLGISTSSRCH